MTNGCRIAVIVCSTGRPDCLAALLPRLRRQSTAPVRIVFVVVSPDDLPAEWEGRGDTPETVFSPKGLPRQRNRGLEAVLEESDVVVFFDDDFVPSLNALSGIVRTFTLFPDVAGVTGVLLADGIKGPGIPLPQAARMVDEHDAANSEAPAQAVEARPDGLYGCNMAFRISAIGSERFDERLPLYAWQEDLDFSVRVPGRLIASGLVTGVHCGVKSGRERRGTPIGYSQIANPAYLVRKGTMRWRFALRLATRNVVANHVRMLAPEDWVDRSGRARGNRIGLADLIFGRSSPEGMLRHLDSGGRQPGGS